MKYKGAIFDLDGTLIDSMPAWKNLGKNYLISLGVSPPEDVEKTLKTMCLQEGAEYFIEEFKLDKTVQEIMDGLVASLEKQYRENIPLKPHVQSFLMRLQEAGVLCCVVTANDPKITEAALARLEVMHFFKFILTCSDVGLGKSDPAIFKKALELLGTGAEETIVFEDALHAIQTAKAAGLTVAALNEPSMEAERQAIQNEADFYLDSFDEWEKIK